MASGIEKIPFLGITSVPRIEHVQPREAAKAKAQGGYQRVDGIAYTNKDGYTGLTDTPVSPLQGQLGLKEEEGFKPNVFVG